MDVGLVPVRDLEITKKADNDANVSDAVFAIYGPYTTEELDNLTAVSAAKKVGEMTSSGNVYSFVSTQSAYLTYADSYLVVELRRTTRLKSAAKSTAASCWKA